MAEELVGGPADEVVPYDLIIKELESALHRSTSENIILRSRLAARDRQATTPPAGTPFPVPTAGEEAAS